MLSFIFTIHRWLNQNNPELREAYKRKRFEAEAVNCVNCPLNGTNVELDSEGFGAIGCSAAAIMGEGRHVVGTFDVKKVLEGGIDEFKADCATTITFSRFRRR